MGDGEHTIVILPGLGTALPSTSFAPLMRELATEHTVVIIDYFGTGFSDRTDRPRTNANVVEEVRTALYAGGFSPPFILMPHSASGVTADYFAIRHPDEVTALVLLDTTHTHEYLWGIGEFTIQASRLQQFTGGTRVMYTIMLSTMGITEENGFTAEEISDIRRFQNHEVNPTTLNRARLFNETIHEVVALDFPQDIPVLSLRPTRPNVGARPEWGEAHMQRYGESSQMIILEGTHNIHNGNHVQIREAINAFLGE